MELDEIRAMHVMNRKAQIALHKCDIDSVPYETVTQGNSNNFKPEQNGKTESKSNLLQPPA
jgi:hypothetical protein